MLAFLGMGRMVFEYTKYYWRPLLMLAVCIALYAVYASQRATIEEVGKALGQVQQDNTLLISSNATLKNDRERADQSYRALNDKNRADAKKLEETERDNERLKKEIFSLQKNDPGANAPVPAGVIRLHDKAIRQFNDKYGSKAPVSSPGGNVHVAR